jgi:hypothetical protein
MFDVEEPKRLPRSFDFGRPKLRGISLPPLPSPPTYGTPIAAIPVSPRTPALPILRRGIRFLDFGFSEPMRFDTAYRQSCGGIYVILVSDRQWGPRPFRPIYFGKASSLVERACRSHEKYRDWVRASGGSLLYIAFHVITREPERIAAERRLILHYKPECNIAYNALAALYGL